jgi:hypothetical protein
MCTDKPLPLQNLIVLLLSTRARPRRKGFLQKLASPEPLAHLGLKESCKLALLASVDIRPLEEGFHLAAAAQNSRQKLVAQRQ